MLAFEGSAVGEQWATTRSRRRLPSIVARLSVRPRRRSLSLELLGSLRLRPPLIVASTEADERPYCKRKRVRAQITAVFSAPTFPPVRFSRPKVHFLRPIDFPSCWQWLRDRREFHAEILCRECFAALFGRASALQSQRCSP